MMQTIGCVPRVNAGYSKVQPVCNVTDNDDTGGDNDGDNDNDNDDCNDDNGDDNDDNGDDNDNDNADCHPGWTMRTTLGTAKSSHGCKLSTTPCAESDPK